jgi:hypothetical protein
MSYWVVGAMFGGSEDQYEMFLRRGYWYCWTPGQPNIPPEAHARFQQVQIGDRIAIKKLLGRGSTEIEIRALGIVTDIDIGEWRIYVNWLVPGLSRRVPLHGCAGSIHGPFEYNDEWTRQVFSL